MKVTRKFERFQSVIWEHNKHKGIGICSLQGAIVKLSSKQFLLYCLTNYPFRLLLFPVTLNLYEYSDGCSTMRTDRPHQPPKKRQNVDYLKQNIALFIHNSTVTVVPLYAP